MWVLFFINFFNYVDRQVIFPLFHNIQAEFHVSDYQLGLLGTIFMLVHSLASLPLGVLADRYPRKNIIAASVGFWSVATLVSGFAASFKALLGVRSVVGIGEAGYAPAATAMISDDFEPSVRAQAQGVFNAGMFAGGTIGAMLGGWIAFYYNWRWAFFIVAFPGVILALLSLKLYDKKLLAEGVWTSVSSLLGNWKFFWILVSATLTTFAGGAYIAWGVEFIRRYKGYNLRDASLILGSTFLVAGVMGVLTGSWLADKLQTKLKYGRALLVAVSLSVAAPLVFIGLRTQHIQFLIFFFFGTMLISFYHGPITVVIQDVVSKKMWATAFAFYLLVAHLLGDTLAPAIVGRISDQYGLKQGLEWSTWLLFFAGLSFLVVCKLINDENSENFSSNS